MTERSGPAWPAVSVIMPVRDEAADLRATLASVLAQDYPGPFEVVVAVAPSRDRTEEVAASAAAGDERVRVVPNPVGTIPAGLNAAVAVSRGDVLVRVDGRSQLPPGYVQLAVELLAETGADNVGGIQHAVGGTPFEAAVAAAMSSRFGVGDARFHYGGAAGPADTVYLGAFRREGLARVGGYDETLLRNEDYELNWRLRQSGGTVWFDPRLRVEYRPRGSLERLAAQFAAYGWWKRRVLQLHPESLRWRQLAAPIVVATNLAGLGLAATGRRWGVLAPAGYLAAAVAATVAAARGHPPAVAARVPLVFATMHHAWGAGFLARQAVQLLEGDP